MRILNDVLRDVISPLLVTNTTRTDMEVEVQEEL